VCLHIVGLPCGARNGLAEMSIPECVFTDPTLSFKGLRTFQKNLANLRPIIDRFVKDYDVVLYSCDLNETRSEVSTTLPRVQPRRRRFTEELRAQVRAEWRMIGTIELPWRPVVNLRGNTRFRFVSP